MKTLIYYCGVVVVNYLVLFVDVSICGPATTSNIIDKQTKCSDDGQYVR